MHVSDRRWLEFHFSGFGGCRSPGRGLFSFGPLGFGMQGTVVLGPWSLGSTRSVLFGDIWPAGVRQMVEEKHRFFGLVHVVFERTLVA